MSNEEVEAQEQVDAEESEVEQVVNDAWRWYVVHAYSGFEAYVESFRKSCFGFRIPALFRENSHSNRRGCGNERRCSPEKRA